MPGAGHGNRFYYTATDDATTGRLLLLPLPCTALTAAIHSRRNWMTNS